MKKKIVLVTAKNPHVLVWAGVDLIFFRVSDLGLCLEFVLETELITQGMFLFLLVRAFTKSRPFLLLPHLLGMHKVMGGTQSGQLIPTDPGDIPERSR